MRDLTEIFAAPEASHACAERDRHSGAAHRTHEGRPPEELYGATITRIDRRAGRWWAHNDEYSTEVTFCPWCGTRLSGIV